MRRRLPEAPDTRSLGHRRDTDKVWRVPDVSSAERLVLDREGSRGVVMANRSRGASVLVVLVVLWLVIGVLAAFQRHYFGGSEKPSCTKVGNIALTIVAG